MNFELQKVMQGEIRLDPASRILYSTDASIYQIEPLGVVLPKTQDDLQAVVELAAKYKVPILPRGAGSSLGGQAIGEALILDCSRWLDSIIEIDPKSHSATVEPGVVLSALNRASAKYGLMFGPDPASAERATMGGVIGNNATGAHSILYGMSADHLLSADVILADGSLETWDENGKSKLVQTAFEIREKYADVIKQNFPKSWRNSAGYRINYLLPWSPSVPPQWANPEQRWSVYESQVTDHRLNLAPLLAGSEGTLAVIRRAKVNLVAKPKHTILGVLAYDSIVSACEDVPRLLEFNPSAVELIPRMIIKLAHGVPEYARQMGWVIPKGDVIGDPAAVLVVEFSGDRPDILKESVRHLKDVMTIAESVEDQARVWNIRKMGLGILDSRPQSARPVAFIEDCAVPVERLGEFVREIERILAEHKAEGGIYAHASAGCLHIRPILDLQRSEGVHALRSIAEQVLALTLRLGGSMSSEHGDGIVTGEWIEKTYGAQVTEAMRMLKQAADPHNLLNPHKMFDAPPMDTHLRYDSNYKADAWIPAIDFFRNGGLVTAIEQCNGQGVCRKDTGVMCPSFQATREEQNSTRGRANLLRALIRMGAGKWEAGSDIRKAEIESAAFGALDLCLACKGCKAECPSGVDIAKLKFAFLAEYYKTHRRPVRDYLFGYFHIVTRVLAPIAPLSNWVMQNAAMKNIVARMLRIAPERPFPKFTLQRAHVRIDKNYQQKVIFLTDAFAHYIEPQVEQAAFDILGTAGYEVIVLPVIGAGASLLSKGFLKEARTYASRVLNLIQKIDPTHSMPVIGIEPPELYMLKHDYIDLLPERGEEIQFIVKNVWLLEEFLVRSDKFSKLRVAINDSSTIKLKFQPHCHQRAEGLSPDGLPSGTQATVSLLRACGYDVEVIDAGCCGMAGTFGYEAEHYELSMKVGGLKLFPKIRELAPSQPPPNPTFEYLLASKISMSDLGEVPKTEGAVVATGAACRMQIQQGAGGEAKHPLEWVAEALK